MESVEVRDPQVPSTLQRLVNGQMPMGEDEEEEEEGEPSPLTPKLATQKSCMRSSEYDLYICTTYCVLFFLLAVLFLKVQGMHLTDVYG